MPESAFRVPVGLDGEFYPYILNAGRPVTTYTGSEAVRARFWAGDDTVETEGVLTNTFDATLAELGKTRVMVNGSATAALLPGWYRSRCEIELDGRWFAYFDGAIELLDVPGSAVLPDAYCTLQDMLDLAGGWLPKLQNELGRTNFAAERARAKSYMDRVVLAHSLRPSGGSGYSIADGYSYAAYDHYDGYVAGLLADGVSLMQDDEWRRAAAYYSLHLACERAFSWEAGDPYALRSRWALGKFYQIIFGYTVRFDTNADGNFDLAIHLGTFSTR